MAVCLSHFTAQGAHGRRPLLRANDISTNLTDRRAVKWSQGNCFLLGINSNTAHEAIVMAFWRGEPVTGLAMGSDCSLLRGLEPGEVRVQATL